MVEQAMDEDAMNTGSGPAAGSATDAADAAGMRCLRRWWAALGLVGAVLGGGLISTDQPTVQLALGSEAVPG